MDGFDGEEINGMLYLGMTWFQIEKLMEFSGENTFPSSLRQRF